MIGGDGDLLDRMRLGINGPSCLSPRGIRARLRGVVRINGNVNIRCKMTLEVGSELCKGTERWKRLCVNVRQEYVSYQQARPSLL